MRRPPAIESPPLKYETGIHLMVAGVVIAALATTLALLATEAAWLNKMPPSVVTYSEGVATVNPDFAVCFGESVRQCSTIPTQTGTITVMSPMIFPDGVGGNHMLQTINGVLQLSYLSASNAQTSLAWFGGGGTQIGGMSPFWLQPNVLTLVANTGEITPPILDGMWVSSSGLAYVDPVSGTLSYSDTVCHVMNASICGTLFRASAAAAGVFFSPDRIIIGAVSYGLILSNLRAFVLVGGPVVLLTYDNKGQAIPCIHNSLYEPIAQNLYLSAAAVGGSCYNYVAKTIHAVPTAQCLPLVGFPAVQSLATSALSAIVTLTDDTQVAVQTFADPLCSSVISTRVYDLGCFNSRFLWYIISQ